MPIIDAHIHLFPDEVVANREGFCRLDPHFAALYANPQARIKVVATSGHAFWRR